MSTFHDILLLVLGMKNRAYDWRSTGFSSAEKPKKNNNNKHTNAKVPKSFDYNDEY